LKCDFNAYIIWTPISKNAGENAECPIDEYEIAVRKLIMRAA